MNRLNKKILFFLGLLTAILIGTAWGQSPSGAAITNTAFASYDGGAGTVLTMPSDTVVTWVRKGSLAVFKSTDATEIGLGDSLVYEIRVQNNGNALLTHVTIMDTLPRMLAYVGSTPEGSADGSVVAWRIPELASGETVSIKLTCRVIKSSYNETIINSVMYSAEGVDSRRSNLVRVRWLPWPEMDLDKTVSPRRAYVGDTLIYAFWVRNVGAAVLTRAEVRDTLPKGINFISSDRAVDVKDGILSWQIGRLEIDSEIRMEFKALVTKAASGDSLRNHAVLSSAEAASDTAVASAALLGQGVGMEIIKQAADSVYAAGDTLTYNLILRNSGIREGHSIVVVDTLPQFLQYVGSTHGGREQDQIVTWNLDRLAAEGLDTLRLKTAIRCPIDDRTMVNNEVWAYSSEGSQDSSHWKIRVISPPKIDMQKRVDRTRCFVGDTLTYTLQVRNMGTMRLTQIQVRDTLPDGTAWIASNAPVDYSRRVVSWNVGNLDYRQIKTVDFRVLVTATVQGDSLRNEAVLSSGQGIVRTASVSIHYGGSGTGIEIKKEAADSLFNAGDTLTYRLILSASEGRAGYRISVRDTLPRYLEYIQSTHRGTNKDGIVTWDLDIPETGYHDTLRVTAAIHVPIEDQMVVNNEVWAASTTGAQDSSHWRIRIISRPGVSFEKKVLQASVMVGDTVAYALRVRNTGTTLLNNIQVSDTLPKGIGFISSASPVDTSGGVLTWNVGRLDYREQRNLTFQALVTPAVSGDSIRNVARLTSRETGRTSASASVALRGQGKGIEIVKKTKKSEYAAGDTLTYDLVLSNGVSRPSTRIIVRDTLPATLQYVRSTHGGACQDGIVAWNLENLNPGYHDTLRVTAVIRVPIEDRTVVVNEVWAYSSVGAQDSSRWSVTVTSLPRLMLEKRGPASVAPGDTIRYMLICSNLGTAAALEPVLSDTLLEYMLFVNADGSHVYLPSARAVHWSLPSLKPGDVDTLYLDVRIAEEIKSRDEIVNSAWLSSDKVSNSAKVTCTARTPLERGILFTYKTVDKQTAFCGDTLTYCIRYGVKGRDLHETACIIDELPKEIEVIRESILLKPSVRFDKYDPVTHQLYFYQDGLTVDNKDSIVFKALVREAFVPGLLVIENRNYLSCSSDTVASMSDKRTRAKTQLLRPFLSVKKTVNRRVTEGGEVLTYTVTCENKSETEPLTSIRVRDVLPEGFRYQEGASLLDSVKNADPEIAAEGKRPLLLWTLPDTLQPGKSVQLKYRVIVGLSVQRGEQENRAAASGLTSDGMRIDSETAKASVLVTLGAFDDKGLIFGKVYEDLNGNGVHDHREPLLKNVELILEDGTRVRTDEFGKYSIPDVEHGQHVLRLNENTLPKDKKILLNDFEYLGDPKSRLIQVPPGGMVRANFAVETIGR